MTPRNRFRSLAALSLFSGAAALLSPAAFAVSSVTLSHLPSNPTTLTSASIGYTLSGTGTVYCRRDTFAPAVCPNPFNLGQGTPLSQGAHKVDFFVDTGAGINTAAPAASYSWQIVTSVPTVKLSNLPSNPTTQTSASISYTLSGTGTVYCRRDGYTPAVCPNPFQIGTATPLDAGSHTVQYFIDSGSGINTAVPAASYTWNVGTSTSTSTAPALALAQMPADLIASGTSSSSWDGSSTVTDSGGNVILSPTSDPKGSGNKVNLHRILRNGTQVWGGVRAENAWQNRETYKLYPGKDYWMAFAVMMKSDEPISSADGEMLVFQTHSPAAGDTQPDVSLCIRGSTNEIRWRVAYNSQPSNTWNYVGGPNPDTEGNIVASTEGIPAAGTWTRYVVHYRPGYTSSQAPMLEIWSAKAGADYTKIVTYSGLNTYNSVVGPSYPRIGLYKWSSSTWNTNSLGFYISPLHFAQGTNLLDSSKAALAGF